MQSKRGSEQMLLDFFVLGLVPGTNLQITYTGLLLAANVTVGLLTVGVFYEIYFVRPKLDHTHKATKKTAKQA